MNHMLKKKLLENVASAKKQSDDAPPMPMQPNLPHLSPLQKRPMLPVRTLGMDMRTVKRADGGTTTAVVPVSLP